LFKIAIVEDEENLSLVTKKYLEKEGYEVITFTTGEDAIAVIGDSIDLWILDIMLPSNISGYDLIVKIKENNPKKPVIFTSARVEEFDRITGLSLGGDDYLSKPFSNRELVLRVKNILSRTYSTETKTDAKEELVNGYLVNFDKRNVTENGQNINLTSKEYDLLLFLLKNKTKAYSRNQILDSVWGDDYFGSDRVVDDLMRRLRKKMPNLSIETIYGYGYRLLGWKRIYQFQVNY